MLMRFKPNMEYRMYFEKGRSIDAVFLPISARHLIMATFATTEPDVKPEEVNIASAQNSKEFIAGPDKSLMESYKDLIGKNNPLITAAEQKLLFKRIIEDQY